MAKIKLTRPHNDQTEIDEKEISAEQLEYFKRVGLIAGKEEKASEETKQEKRPYKTKQGK